MSGSTEFASAKPSGLPPPRDLVVSVNWIGDAIMAMPALQVYRAAHPAHRITILARRHLAELWQLHPAADDVIRQDNRAGFSDPLFATLRREGFTTAWILPNSFRSAWVPFRAGIPQRIGFGGGLRHPLLTTARRHTTQPERRHQAWEYLALLCPDIPIATLPPPTLRITPEDATAARATAGLTGHEAVIGMVPGAARGPAKRWPPDRFTAVGRRLAADGFRIALFGGPEDATIGRVIAADIGAAAINLTGRTSIATWAALLAGCRVVIANDSGGMHLAAALGRPVVALYGITDPERTGPLGTACTILQNSQRRTRDIARSSAEAARSLAAIHPDAVYEAAHALLARAPHPEPS